MTKDFIGNNLNINDRVAFSIVGDTGLFKGKITKINAKTVSIYYYYTPMKSFITGYIRPRSICKIPKLKHGDHLERS
jgi:hypothetical protein